MKIVSFSVTNFRSITKAHKIQLDKMTVLVGKNNEGKSNILKALTLSMNIMMGYGLDTKFLKNNLYMKRKYYVWERDFPISLQNSTSKQQSIFDLDFELNEIERQELKKITGIRVGENIPIRITLGDCNASISVPKRGSSSFKEHSQEITDFICKKIYFYYIPAVRTEHDAISVINDIITEELSKIDKKPEVISALSLIDKLHQDALDSIADKLIEPLSLFIPSIKDVKIYAPNKYRTSLNSHANVFIDDGTLTDIQMKGDGIKSLTALAMLNMQLKENAASVIAIEEPESHLHPDAIHELYETINKLSKNNQVIISTHNPLFINRSNVRNNIIVDNGKASQAKSIKEIRDILGVIPSDNLINANVVLVVEGEDDKISLLKLLPNVDESINKAIKQNILVIDEIGGAGNLAYKLSLYNNIMCKYHVLLDNDVEGNRAFELAESKKLLSIKNATFINCEGYPESEFEECLNPEIYKDIIMDKFGVDIKVSDFRGNKKWSIRMKKCFLRQGKPWNESIEKKVKLQIANSIPADIEMALSKHKRNSIDALVTSLKKLI